MSFTSVENKRLLWDIMYNNDVFSLLPDTKVIEVMEVLESIIKEIEPQNIDLVTKNKLVIKKMIAYVDRQPISAQESQPISAQESQPISAQESRSPPSDSEMNMMKFSLLKLERKVDSIVLMQESLLKSLNSIDSSLQSLLHTNK